MSLDAEPIVTPERKREFLERGLLVTDVLFTPDELEPVRRECVRVYEETTRAIRAKDQQRVRPFLPSPHVASDAIGAFTRHRVFQRIAREMIGPDVDQVWNQVCLKLPDENELTEFPFHQDSKFAEIDYQSGGCACFVALAPLSVENGTLSFAARAHTATLAHRWNEYAHWWQCEVDGYEIVPGVLAAGQMVIYHPLTPHGSPPNRTSAPREAFLLGLGPPGVRRVDTGEAFGDQRPLLRDGRQAF